MKKEKIKENLKTVGKDVGRGVGGYVKAKLWMLLITLIILLVGILISGVPFYLVIPLALLITLIDLLPVIGSGIVLIPWSVIAFLCDNIYMGIIIAVTYLILLIGRQIIEPKIMGDSIGVSPLITFISTVAGALVFGGIGLIIGPMIAVVITSIIRIVKKIKKENKDETDC